MDKMQAERLITELTKPLFAFALRRCASIQDAEDVAQEAALRAYRALLTRDDISDPIRYVWMVARNVLANHYRAGSRIHVGVPEDVSVDSDPDATLVQEESVRRLYREIAALSRQQREIVVGYYFHGRKQAELAAQLGIPLGTVKWHLFEAKKELKENMETNRHLSHLQFDPIRFTAFGTEGSLGDEGSPWRIFRSALHQNIAYAVWQDSRTVREIADAMDVSPVYIEDAVDYMTSQGYLSETNGRYRCTLLLTEVTNDLTAVADHMYQEAATLIAPTLHEALVTSDIWTTVGFYPGADMASDTFATARKDQTYALWALIPWCIAHSQPDKAISFNDVAILRPDGARNILHATIASPGAVPPSLYNRMDGHFSGPCWNEFDGMTLWQLDTCWSDTRIGEIYQHEAETTLLLLKRLLASESLSREEYARLAEKRLLRITGDPDAVFTASLVPVWLQGQAIRQKLLHTTADVYAQHQEALAALLQPYAEALLAQTPAHLHKLRQYMLQNVYQSDWFIMHCLQRLSDSGLLPPPVDADRKSLHTVLLSE